jgi:hypothetical protein
LQETQGQAHDLAMKLLYILSSDDRAKSIFTYTEVIPTSMRMILENTSERLPFDLMALVCNLASNARNAEVICGEASEDTQPIGLKLLIKRAFKTKDPLLWKLLRILISHDANPSIRLAFLPYMDDLGKLLVRMQSTISDFNKIQRPMSSLKNGRPSTAMKMDAAAGANPTSSLTSLDPSAVMVIYVELLGIFGSLEIPDFDYVKLATNFGMLDILRQQLNRSLRSQAKSQESLNGELAPPPSVHSEDDILLECIIILATFSRDPEFIDFILSGQTEGGDVQGSSASADVPLLLVELLTAKQEDDELMLQTLYALYQLLLQNASRQLLLKEAPQLVSYLMDLAYDGNAEVRKMCDACLDLIVDTEMEKGHAQHAEEIKIERFRKHNQVWLQLVGAEEGDHTFQTEPTAYGEENDSQFNFGQYDTMHYDLDDIDTMVAGYG